MKIYPLTIYYESACPLCNAEIINLKSRNGAGLLRFIDVSAPGFVPQLGGLTQRDLLGAIHAQRADGAVVKGVDVIGLAYNAVGVQWIATLIRWPLLGAIAAASYRLLARIRRRIPPAVIKLLRATVFRPARGTTARDCDTGCHF
jgi:predicted DCC family thiol-disulfide oxidoreductase YuxK